MVAETSSDNNWSSYYEKTGFRPPRKTLLRALDLFESEASRKDRLAVDLGSGSGRDTVEILRRGWRALAIDAESAAIDMLRDRRDLPENARLETLVARNEEVALPVCDLVNSSFALPLCPREVFPQVWERIVAALRPGGRFSGQLYGDRDSWAGNPDMSHHDLAEVENLLQDLRVEFFEEEEDDSLTPRGKNKHWHIFHIVARKPL